MDGVGKPSEGVAVLASAGFDDGEQSFDESAAGRGLRAEREFSPDDGVPQRLLGGVVGRLDAGDIDEGPEVFLVLDEFPAEATRARVEVTAQQQRVDRFADRFDAATEGAMREGAVADVLPEGEHFFGGSPEVVSEAFAGVARAVDEGLEVAEEMSPAPLQSTFAARSEAPIHAGAVAADDALVCLAEKFLKDVGGAAGAAGEEGEAGGDERPDPGFARALLGRRFVDVERFLFWKLGGEFVVGGFGRLGGESLQFDHPGRAGGLVENRAHEQGGPPFRLAKAGHEHGGEGDEPRPGLAGGHAFGKFPAGAAPARADEAVLPIFGDDGLDLGKFPDLMAKGFGIGPRESFAALAALVGNDLDDLGTLLRRNERTFVLVVPRLAAAFAFRCALARLLGKRLVVRMCGRRRHRRIRGSLPLKPLQSSELVFEFRDASGQPNDRIGLRTQQRQHRRRRRGKIGLSDLGESIHASCKNTQSPLFSLDEA